MKYLVFLFVFLFSVNASEQREIIKVALSFDDAPMTSSYLGGQERTGKLLKTLEKNKVKAVFFVNSAKFDNYNGYERIKKYDSAGHFIANHTASHPMLSKVSAAEYISEIIECDKKIKNFKNFRKWFRYPYLDQSRDIPKRDSVWNFLDENDYKIGYCTIDNYEWYINSQFNKNIGNDINFDKFKEYYFNHILESIHFYNNIAINTLGYSPPHILLLHENDINALFLDELIAFLNKHNIELICPDDAYANTELNKRPDVEFNYQGRVASIAYANDYNGKLVQKSENTKFLDSLFIEYEIVNLPLNKE